MLATIEYMLMIMFSVVVFTFFLLPTIGTILFFIWFTLLSFFNRIKQGILARSLEEDSS